MKLDAASGYFTPRGSTMIGKRTQDLIYALVVRYELLEILGPIILIQKPSR